MNRPESVEEVKLAAAKMGLPELEAEKFYHYYESRGWVQGKSRAPMKRWLSALTGWKFRWQETNTREQSTKSASKGKHWTEMTDAEIMRQAMG